MGQSNREQLKVVAEKAVLAGLTLPGDDVNDPAPFAELHALVQTAGASVVGEIRQRRQKPRGATYMGKGKVDELRDLVQMTNATLVVFDNDLSPAQVKNLEEAVSCKIIDRSELILDIFANRASTHMARLQVEIAQLEYTYPRLRAMWDHLGGIVGGAPVGIGTRGPGEKQLEIDRRLVQTRLQQLKRELRGIGSRKTREVEQRNLDFFTVGLVGYTNAGKSTLFNRLTDGGAYAHDKLFATLSTRVERWPLGNANGAMLSDTVGFIQDLPHHLVASFRSTLEETIFASLLLIVLDVSEDGARDRLDVVVETLDSIGATGQQRVLVLNKVDRLEDRDELLLWLRDYPNAIAISAVTGEGIEDLTSMTLGAMIGPLREVEVSTPLSDARGISFLEQRTEILGRDYDGDGACLRVRIGRRQMDEYLSKSGNGVRINGMEPLEAIRMIWKDMEDGSPDPASSSAESLGSSGSSQSWRPAQQERAWSL